MWENSIEFSLTKFEDAADFFVHESPSDFAEDAERQGVVKGVLHQHPAVLFGEPVHMVPESIGSESLLINKVRALSRLSDLRDPAHGNVEQRTNFVDDDLTGKRALACPC